MAYITKDQITALQFQPSAAEGETLASLISRAERTIDRLCGVKSGHFDVASDTPSDRSFAGTGTAWLRLPPHAEELDIATDVAYASGYSLPEFDYIQDDLGFYFLRCKVGQRWRPTESIVVSARWGFAAVPDEIQEATIELVLAMWRTADPARERAVSDAGGEVARAPQLPGRVREICAQWKALQTANFA